MSNFNTMNPKLWLLLLTILRRVVGATITHLILDTTRLLNGKVRNLLTMMDFAGFEILFAVFVLLFVLFVLITCAIGYTLWLT